MTWPRVTHESLPWSTSPDVPMPARARSRIPSSYESDIIPTVADAALELTSEQAASLSEASAGRRASGPGIKGNAPLIVANAKLMAAAAIAHAQFDAIHPFADGNGRTGRALVHVVLADAGLCSHAVLPLSARLLHDKAGYFGTLDEYRDGRPGPIIELFARSAVEAAELGTWAAAELESIRGDWHRLVTGRAGTPDATLVDVLLAQPIVGVEFAAEAADCSSVTARRSLERLEGAGIVIGYQATKRRRARRAPGVFELMDRVDSGLGCSDKM